jgi:hypothetical protein
MEGKPVRLIFWALVGIPVGIFLHNVICGQIFVRVFDRPDLDDPVFFIMAIVVCPIGF